MTRPRKSRHTKKLVEINGKQTDISSCQRAGNSFPTPGNRTVEQKAPIYLHHNIRIQFDGISPLKQVRTPTMPTSQEN
jgi:hypothetical protein